MAGKNTNTSSLARVPPNADADAASATNTPAAIAADHELENEEEESWEEEDIMSTASITSSILEYRNLHGRTFGSSKTTHYWAPNDTQQNEGLDLTHHYLLLYFDNKLFHAPIGKSPQKVLDLGTGTGIWAVDFADMYPSAEVIGIDISPIQPKWVPPNVQFQIDDIQLEWTWEKEIFDYIHIRDLYGSISDWPALYKKAYDHLKPGGWFEDHEADIRTHSDVVGDDPDHIYNRWNRTFLDSGEKQGKTLKIGIGSRMKNYIVDAGFVNVVERRIRIPIGPWCKDKKLKQIGRYLYAFIDQSLEGFALFLLTKILDWKYEECQVFIAQMRDAIKNYRNLHPYLEMNIVYGQKPQ